MKVSQIMTSNVVSVAPDTPFKEVVERLVHAEVSSLPVVEADGKIVGLITEADLISKEAYTGRRHRALALLADVLSARDQHWVAKSAGSVARDVMTTTLMVCRPEEDVRAVARRMLERRVKRMPVVDNGVLVGIVSRQDILRTFDRPDAAIAADVEALVTTGVNMPDDHHVTFAVERGVVTLGGDVRYAWDAPIVVAMVRDLPGVIDVVNQMRNRERNPRPSTEPWMFGVR